MNEMPETFAHLEETKNALTKQAMRQQYEIDELRGALETILSMLDGQTSAVAASLRAVAQSSLDCTGD